MAAIRELLDRMMGKSKSTIELQQTEFANEELEREIDEQIDLVLEQRIAERESVQR